MATRKIRSRRNKDQITSTEVRRCQQSHVVLVRSEVERLEAYGVREEFSAWCKTQTSDLTVAVEKGSEEKVDVKASSAQLGAASESLRTKIRDLGGCVTITKERSLGAEPN